MIKLRKKERMTESSDHQVYKSTVGDYVFCTINITIFLLFTLLCFFPFYYLFINTISDNNLVTSGKIMFIPLKMHLDNYRMVFYMNDFLLSVWITVSRTVLGTTLMVIVSAFAGYLFTKRKMWAHKFWYRFIIVPMYFNAGLIPWYLTMFNLGLTNNYLAYILPGMVVPFNIILVKTYIESLPPYVEESAIIDGAGTFTIFFRIIWPLSLPILATIAIFGAVSQWNSFQDSLILMQGNRSLFTLQHRLYDYLKKSTNLASQIREGVGGALNLDDRIIQYTIAMVSIIPIVLLYPFMQRYFIKGIMMGAVKG
jgi:multiple sugar transport system permease protein/putative aldouronate transport system permease protein